MARLSIIREEDGGAAAARSLLPVTAAAVLVLAVASEGLARACLIGEADESGDGRCGVRAVFGTAGSVPGDAAFAVDAGDGDGGVGVTGADSPGAGDASGTEGVVVVAGVLVTDGGTAAVAAAAVDGVDGDTVDDGATAGADSGDTTLPTGCAWTLRAAVHAGPPVAWLLLVLRLLLLEVVVVVGPEQSSTRASARERTALAFRRWIASRN